MKENWLCLANGVGDGAFSQLVLECKLIFSKRKKKINTEIMSAFQKNYCTSHMSLYWPKFWSFLCVLDCDVMMCR